MRETHKPNAAGEQHFIPPLFFQRTLDIQKDELNQKYVFMRTGTIAASPCHSPLPAHIYETSFFCSVIKYDAVWD